MPDHPPNPENCAASDETLVARVLAGDLAAYEPLVTRYQSYIWTLIARQAPGAPVAELTQEVLVAAYQGLGQWRGSSLKGWLAGIAIRRCQDYWRRQGRRPATPLSALGEDLSATLDQAMAGAAEEQFTRDTDRREWREILDWALAQLNADDRLAITLLHLEDHPLRQVADWLGWSLAKTKVRGFRARQNLRRLLTLATPAHGRPLATPPSPSESAHENSSG